MQFNLTKFKVIACFLIITFGWSRSVLAIMNTLNATQYQVNKIADAFENAYFEHFPEEGLLNGRARVALDRFTDYSLDSNTNWQKQEDQFLAELQKLNPNELKGTHQLITYQLLKQTIENNRAARICKNELWNVDHLRGWHVMLGIVAEKQPIGTPELRNDAFKRWSTFNQVAEIQIHNLKMGLREGYTAPKSVVLRVLNQIKMMLEMPTEESPYFDFAKRDSDLEFKKKIAELIEININPALKKYAAFLETEYLPKARNKIGFVFQADKY